MILVGEGRVKISWLRGIPYPQDFLAIFGRKVIYFFGIFLAKLRHLMTRIRVERLSYDFSTVERKITKIYQDKGNSDIYIISYDCN